eukprot:gene3353-6637_t
MGNIMINLMNSLVGPTPKRLIVVGLDAAGKTTILYKLKVGETVCTIPTVGFNVETVRYKNIEFTCWDIGGQNKIRQLWHHYYEGTHGVIFTVDANDRSRLEEAKYELYRVMGDDHLRDAALLVYANKMDLPHSMSVSEIAEALGLSSKLRNRKWHVKASVAVSGEGLYEGLDWLGKVLSERKR